MTVASDIVGQGTLTGGAVVDTVRTGAGTEYHVIAFHNYSGATVTLDLFINGVANQNRLCSDIAMLTKETVVIRIKIGSGDTIRAEAGAAASIAWTDMMDNLT